MAFILGFACGFAIGAIVAVMLCVKFFSLLKRIMFK